MNSSKPPDFPFPVVYRATRGLFFAILGGFALRYGLDRYFHTNPWCALAGIFGGTFLGFYELIRAARTSN
jgi:F0F1-type ATP synthase assembly protein I